MIRGKSTGCIRGGSSMYVFEHRTLGGTRHTLTCGERHEQTDPYDVSLPPVPLHNGPRQPGFVRPISRAAKQAPLDQTIDRLLQCTYIYRGVFHFLPETKSKYLILIRSTTTTCTSMAWSMCEYLCDKYIVCDSRIKHRV